MGIKFENVIVFEFSNIELKDEARRTQLTLSALLLGQLKCCAKVKQLELSLTFCDCLIQSWSHQQIAENLVEYVRTLTGKMSRVCFNFCTCGNAGFISNNMFTNMACWFFTHIVTLESIRLF